MNHFKVGEIVIVKHDPTLTPDPENFKYNGEECEVTEPYDLYETTSDKLMWGYVVTMRDGEECICAPHELRRKQPPLREIDEVVSWEDCGWQPETEKTKCGEESLVA